MCFSMGVKSIKGTVLEKRVEHLAKTKENVVIYTPKNSTFNNNLDKYPPDVLQYMKEVMRPMLIYFGYAKAEGVETTHSYIDIGPISVEEMKTYNGYIRDNAEHMEVSLKYGKDIARAFEFDNHADWNQRSGTWAGIAYHAYYGESVQFFS